MNKALESKCPYCGSAAGVPCVDAFGAEMQKMHGARRPRQPPAGLAELSDAIATAGELGRKAKAALEKVRAKQIKQCPCHGKVCAEVGKGMKVCPVGVCVRMN